MRMCDLADTLQLSPSGFTRRLDGLVRGGLVERRNSDADRRVMLAVLTDAGRERLAEAAPIHVASVRARIIDRLDHADLEAMLADLQQDPCGPRQLTTARTASVTNLPSGFHCHVANIGIKDDTDDFVVVAAEHPVAAAGVFTRSRFAGPSVIVSRDHVADHCATAIVVVSKNANVANGADGARRRPGARRRRRRAASAARPTTCWSPRPGVIGRPYPMDRIRAGLAAIPDRITGRQRRRRGAAAIMTTDTVAKVAEAPRRRAAGARVVGVAKGVGMIEPDMATMITILFTDADVDGDELDDDLPPGRRPHVQLRQHRHRHLHQRHRRRPGQRRGRHRRPGCVRARRCTTSA